MKSAAELRPARGLELWLLRHGATEWARNGRHTGSTDLPLLAEGEDEARSLAPLLQGIAFTAVATSPLQRARRTCELAGLGAAAQIWEDLHEWDYGAYEGLTTAEIRRSQSDWTIWSHGCPAGEDAASVQVRCERVIARALALATRPPDSVTPASLAPGPHPARASNGGRGSVDQEAAGAAPAGYRSATSTASGPEIAGSGTAETVLAGLYPGSTEARASASAEHRSQPGSLPTGRTAASPTPISPSPDPTSPVTSSEPPCRIALFAHGHLLRSLAATWLGLGVQGGALLVLGTGGIGVLGYERQQRALLRWNVTAQGQLLP